jgi:glycine cleavage system H protein
MSSPADRQYSTSHEWHKEENGLITLGVTQFAVNALTDVTFAEMKGVGFKFERGQPIGVVESVKTTSDIYCAAPGEIVAVNEALINDPSLINQDCYGKGWLCKIKPSGPLSGTLDAKAYDAENPL